MKINFDQDSNNAGNVDVSVAVASRFLDESELTMPVLHQCGHYEGPIVEDSMKVGISCLEAGGDDSSSDGLSGYAVYAKFNGNLSDTSASICRMDIVLYDSKLTHFVILLILTADDGYSIYRER